MTARETLTQENQDVKIHGGSRRGCWVWLVCTAVQFHHLAAAVAVVCLLSSGNKAAYWTQMLTAQTSCSTTLSRSHLLWGGAAQLIL